LRKAPKGDQIVHFDFSDLTNDTATPFAIALPQDRTERLLFDAVTSTGMWIFASIRRSWDLNRMSRASSCVLSHPKVSTSLVAPSWWARMALTASCDRHWVSNSRGRLIRHARWWRICGSLPRLVYITAFAPDKGESVGSLLSNPPPGAPVPPILPPPVARQGQVRRVLRRRRRRQTSWRSRRYRGD
jgi:hypothetical protein